MCKILMSTYKLTLPRSLPSVRINAFFPLTKEAQGILFPFIKSKTLQAQEKPSGTCSIRQSFVKLLSSLTTGTELSKPTCHSTQHRHVRSGGRPCAGSFICITHDYPGNPTKETQYHPNVTGRGIWDLEGLGNWCRSHDWADLWTWVYLTPEARPVLSINNGLYFKIILL